MTKQLFITATGTDIGKTYISALLVKKMIEYEFNCGYYKPVLSGAIRIGDVIIPGDCKYVTDISGLNIKPTECLSYCFEEAVSPHLAAQRTGTNISIDKILNDYNNLSKRYDYVLIEGAGGITCPIISTENKVYLMSDLIKDLKVNVIIVADGGLGTINSVLTTVEYAKARGINIEGIILNKYDKTDFMHKDNLKMVEKLTGIKVIATIAKDDKDIDISKQILEGLFN